MLRGGLDMVSTLEENELRQCAARPWWRRCAAVCSSQLTRLTPSLLTVTLKHPYKSPAFRRAPSNNAVGLGAAVQEEKKENIALDSSAPQRAWSRWRRWQATLFLFAALYLNQLKVDKKKPRLHPPVVHQRCYKTRADLRLCNVTRARWFIEAHVVGVGVERLVVSLRCTSSNAYCEVHSGSSRNTHVWGSIQLTAFDLTCWKGYSFFLYVYLYVSMCIQCCNKGFGHLMHLWCAVQRCHGSVLSLQM